MWSSNKATKYPWCNLIAGRTVEQSWQWIVKDVKTCPPIQKPLGQLDLGDVLILQTDNSMSAPANGARNGSIQLVSVLSQLMHTDLNKREFLFVSTLMQKYRAKSLFPVEEETGYLLYVVGHFVRRDGALPRYLHGTCMHTQHFILNVMCMKPVELKRTVRSDATPVCVQKGFFFFFFFFTATNLLCFHRALLGRV